MIKLEKILTLIFTIPFIQKKQNIRKLLYGKPYVKMEKRNIAGGWEARYLSRNQS